MHDCLKSLYRNSKTVFSSSDLALLWHETNQNNLKAKVYYLVKSGVLVRLRRGLFALDKNFEPLEAASLVLTPSYISFETALARHGIIFQHYETIYLASYTNKTFKIGDIKIQYRKLKDTILNSPNGIDLAINATIAGPERAFLDMLYLFPDYYFDNPGKLNWDACKKIVQIYDNRALEKRLNLIIKEYA